MGVTKVNKEMQSSAPQNTTYHHSHLSFRLEKQTAITLETEGLDQLGNQVGKVQEGDVVGVHIRGYFMDKNNKKKEYEDTRHSEKLCQFKIGANQRIPGLESAVLTMQLGEEATFTITSDVGYGDKPHQGYSTTVPPNSDLILEISLMKIIRDGTIYLRKRPKDNASCGLKCLYYCFRAH